MKKKSVSLLMLASMMTTMAAGCGNKAANNAGSDAAADNSTTSDAAAEETAGTEAAAVDTAGTEAAAADSEDEPWSGTITVWSPQEDQDTGWLAKECDAFNAAHPNWDITFNYGVCAEGDAKATVTQDVENSADVYMLANDNIPDLVSAGALSELGGDYLGYVTSTNSDSILASVTYNDSVVAFPFTPNTWFMYYDKSVFSEDDVKNFDTMLEKAGEAGKKVSFKLTDSWYIEAFYVANGCTLFGDGTDNDAGINFGGDNGKAVTDYLVDLVANKNFVNDESGEGNSGMTDGSIAAMFSGSWDYKALHDALGDDLGIAAMPTAKIGGSDKQLLSFAGSKAIGVNPNCEYPQVAVALALYLGNEESQQSHYEARSIVPCNTNLLESDTVKNDALVTAQNDTFNNTSMIQPFVPKMSNFWTPAENFGKALLNGEVTHDNAAEQTEAFNTSLNTDVAE